MFLCVSAKDFLETSDENTGRFLLLLTKLANNNSEKPVLYNILLTLSKYAF